MGTVENSSNQTRRDFLARVASVAVLAKSDDPSRSSNPPAAFSRDQLQARRRAAYELRDRRARAWLGAPLALPSLNGDESKYSKKIGNFSKGLPHNALGHVDTAA